MTDMSLAVVIWAVLALAIASLIVYRKAITAHEDDSVHLAHETGKTADQAALAQRVEAVDRWGKTLTVITAAYGVALLGYWIYVNTFGNTMRGL